MNRSARELQVTIAAEGLSALFVLQPEESADYAITGTFTGTVDLEISSAPGSHFETAVAGAANTGNSGTLTNDAGEPRWYRFRSKSWTGERRWRKLCWVGSYAGRVSLARDMASAGSGLAEGDRGGR